MKHSGNTLTKSTSKLKSSKNSEIINISIFKESEIVVRSVIEKLISLVISNTFEKMIQRNIPNFCLLEIKKRLDNIIELQYIKHDKDDLKRKNVVKNKSQKNFLNINGDYKKNLLLTEEKIINKKLNKSQIIPDYELIKNLNPYGENFFEEKIYLNILTRKNVQKNKIIFLNKYKKNNNIRIEEHNKIDNFWDTILQPNNTKIDRGASTQIKMDNETFKRINLENIPENIQEENQNQEKIEEKQNIPNNSNIIKKKNIKNNIKKENVKNEKKLKLLIQTDLPSFDLEPEKIGIIDENESIKVLRKEYEIQLALKKEKEEKEKKLMKQKRVPESDEDNIGKKFFFNSKVNTVKIKPIKLENLLTEFQGLKSQTKEIGKITDVNIDTQSHKSDIKVEINENPDYQFIEERTERKRKKFFNQNNSQNNNNLNILHNIKKNRNERKENEIMERSGSKYASGSNFNLIKLECGVELTENRKKKSGGKNYFEKYGRFSYELFQNKLNKTMSENFMANDLKDLMNNSMKKEEKETENIRKDNRKKSTIKKAELLSNKELIREKSEYDAKFEVPNGGNEYLNIKTKNLRIVMNNLDLMKDFELNIDTENNYIPQTKYNFFKNKINKNFKKSKKDLKEINDFNKTVLKNNFWGEPNNQNIKDNMYNNIKPPFHFSHNKKRNINFPIIGLPRQRLPPISSIRLLNNDITKRRIDFGKVKIKNLSTDNLINDDEKKVNI